MLRHRYRTARVRVFWPGLRGGPGAEGQGVGCSPAHECRTLLRYVTVQSQLFLLLDDNYFSRPTTITFCHLGRSEAYARGRLPFRDGSGRWECGQPAFGFPLSPSPSSPELWKCGNLACSWRDFQAARGKRGRPAFGLPTLSTDAAFPQLSFLPRCLFSPARLSGSFNCRWPGDLIVADHCCRSNYLSQAHTQLTELPQEPVLGPESWRLSSKTQINSLGSCLNSLRPSITTMSGLSPWFPALSLFPSQLVEKLVPDRGFF